MNKFDPYYNSNRCHIYVQKSRYIYQPKSFNFFVNRPAAQINFSHVAAMTVMYVLPNKEMLASFTKIAEAYYHSRSFLSFTKSF